MPREDWPETTPERLLNGQYPAGRIQSVLDVGCGLSVRSQFMRDAKRIVALDVYRPYLERARVQAVRDDIIYLNASAHDIEQLFLSKSFDMVLLQDVIEHFDKRAALALIDIAERIARVAVFINTPEGFVKQDIDTWGLGGDFWQTHRSGWQASEFKRMGYYTQTRDYRMCDVPRRLDGVRQDTQIQVIDAIKVLS